MDFLTYFFRGPETSESESNKIKMDDKEPIRTLFEDFPKVTTREWEEKISADLKGADYRKKLIWETPEGFEVKPYYRSENLQGLDYLKAEPGESPYTRGVRTENNAWVVRQDIHEADPARGNLLSREAIKRGAQDLGLNAKLLTEHKQMHVLLDGIDLEKTGIHFVSSKSYPLTLELFLYEVGHHQSDPQHVNGSLNFDFISYLLRHGDFYISLENNTEEAVYLLQTIRKKLPNLRAITVNGHLIRESGSTLVQELAFSLASGNDYINLLRQKGFSVDEITPHIQFSFSVGSDYFLEIAKLRAARMLWSHIVGNHEPSGDGARKMYLHARTAEYNKTVYDPYVNMLRTTTEGMSAVLGNADSVSITPFDRALAGNSELGERIARNQQLIMREEAYLDKIIDPAAGSYYIESLTDAIATHAWDLFLKVESRGGLIESIKSGFVQEQVEESARSKASAIAQRRLVLLGTNQYPNIGELMGDQVAYQEQKNNAPEGSSYKKLEPFRIASAFEEIRLATEAYVGKGNKRPSVFLFTFGNLGMLRARASFTTNFFGCGGYSVIDNPGFSDIEDGVRQAVESKSEIIVLCSSDDEYPLFAGAVCSGIRVSAPGTQVIVAGYPKDHLEALKLAGVDDFIHVRSNLLETLEKYHKKIGIR